MKNEVENIDKPHGNGVLPCVNRSFIGLYKNRGNVMNDKKIQIVDLLISHSQILLRSRDYDEKLSQWGKGNVSQGAVLHKDYVIFDPLPEDAFGANVNIKIENAFKLDENAQRCIVVPFFITDKHKLQIASATEKFDLNIDVNDKVYSLFYEICEGDEIL